MLILPRKEMEAWAIADPEAVGAALELSGRVKSIDWPQTPAEAERVQDPKALLVAAVRSVRGARASRIDSVLSSVAQRQSLSILRGAPSFAQFEQRLFALSKTSIAWRRHKFEAVDLCSVTSAAPKPPPPE